MQKASIGKILLALVISCVYIYLFGIVQVVHVSADNEREIEVSIPEATTSAETEKTPETTTIKLQDDKKPTLADVKAQTTATTKAETTTLTKISLILYSFYLKLSATNTQRYSDFKIFVLFIVHCLCYNNNINKAIA